MKAAVGFLPWWPQNPYQLLLKKELNAAGLRVIGNPPLSILRLLVRRDGLDIVHVHWPHGLYLNRLWRYPYIVLLLFLYRLIKNNIVWTVHELEAYESSYVRLDGWLRGRLFKWSRALIVHGSFTERRVRSDYGYRGPVSIARHPPYAGWYKDTIRRGEARNALGIPVDRIVYLYFGYIKPYKGVEDLIAAFRKMDDAKSVLIIVGRPLNTAIESSIRQLAAFDHRIQYHLRYVPDDEVQVFFRASDVVVLPFRRTETSGSALMALVFGKPCVAPTVGTIPEYFDRDFAEFFDPDERDDLANALRRISVRDHAAMGAAARSRCNRLTWSDFGNAHLEAYEHVLPGLRSMKRQPITAA